MRFPSAKALIRQQKPAIRELPSLVWAREPTRRASLSGAPRSAAVALLRLQVAQFSESTILLQLPSMRWRSVWGAACCGKANTEIPRSRLNTDLALPRNNGSRHIPFPCKTEPTRASTSSPFNSRYTGRKPFPLRPLPPTRAPYWVLSTGSAGPLSSWRRVSRLCNASHVAVEHGQPDTSCRTSGH